MKRGACLIIGVLAVCASGGAEAAIVSFFDASQPMTQTASGVTSDTIQTEGYQFTYTQDKLFTGGVGLTEPIGRSNLVTWPDGLHAQGITQPTGGKARLTVTRVDGDVFDIIDFGFKLLANTAGAGATLEVTPQLDGEDAFNDPIYFEATGYYSQSFAYSRTPSPFLNQSTTQFNGYDTYVFSLYVDFALTSLTVNGAAISTPEPASLTVMAMGAMAMRRTRRRAV